MQYNKPLTCMETCGQEKHCGNRYCSAHPLHYQVMKTKKPKKDKPQGYRPYRQNHSRPVFSQDGGSEPRMAGRRSEFSEESLPFYFGRQR